MALVREGSWREWLKWASRTPYPSRDLQALASSGGLQQHPELSALPGVPQDPEWHPEGDVWVHTLFVCDAAARIAEREGLNDTERTVLLFAALCHDLGKASTTELQAGRWRAHGHCEAGVALTRSFLERIGCPQSIIEVVEPLVREHLIHAQTDVTPKSVRRLARRLGKATIAQLMQLVEADLGGRPPLPGGLPETAQRILELSSQQSAEVVSPQPLILGRHLIGLGHRPSVWFGDVLRECFNAQMAGVFDTEADGVKFLEELLRNRQPK